MSDPYIGEIRAMPYTFAPYGWVVCEGQLLPTAQYQALLAVIGNIYGGDGVNNFAVPDLRGRVAISMGQGPNLSNHPIAQASGTENIGLNSNTLPAHSHNLAANALLALKAASTPANNGSPAGNSLSALASGDSTNRFNTADADTAMNAACVTVSGKTEATGGADNHGNIQPSLVIRYCIATEGVFPVRT